MAESRKQRPFTAEILRMGKKAFEASLSPTAAEEAACARHEEVMAIIHDLRQAMGGTLPAANPNLEKDPGEDPENGPENGLHDPEALKRELEGLRVAIIETKQEIAALRHPAANSDRILTATDELDAVVQATELATQSILETAEQINELTDRVKQSSTEKHTADLMDDINELVVKIFESCNFQDITGQRISKVVSTMRFIEERVNTMIGIWGTEAFHDIAVPEPAIAEGEDALLSGPQMEESGISQDDIDKMFD